MNVDIDKDDFAVNKIEEIIQLLMHQNELLDKQNKMMQEMMEKTGHCSK